MPLRSLACLLFCWNLSVACAADSLRLVSGDDYAPFTGRELPGGGLLVQVVEAALASQEIAHSLDWRPWKRGYLMAQRGEYDATFPYIHSVERERDFLYSEPLFVTRQYLFSLAGQSFEMDDPAGLAGKRICYPLGWQAPPAIQQLIDDGRLVRHEPAGLAECARLLLLRRDDLFVADQRLGEAALRATGEPLTRFRRSTGQVGSNRLHLIVSRQHPRGAEIVARFNAGLAALHADGRYRAIVEGYLQQP